MLHIIGITFVGLAIIVAATLFFHGIGYVIKRHSGDFCKYQPTGFVGFMALFTLASAFAICYLIGSEALGTQLFK